MQRVTGRGIAGRLLVLGAVGIALVGACAEKKGALMLAINTDMKAPRDVNAVSVTVSTNGAIKHSFIGRVTPQGEVLLPATLAIVEPDDKRATIRVRVMAFQDRKPRVLRDVRTTVPSGGRTALLRIPLNFVNDASAVGEPLPDGLLPPPLPGTATTSSGGPSGTDAGAPAAGGGLTIGAGEFDFFGAFQPPCPDIQNETIIDGACADNFVDPDALPDFDSEALGSSTDQASCFDVAKCFATAVGIGESAAAAPRDAGVATDPGSSAGDSGAPAAAPGFDGGTPFRDFVPAGVTLDRNACALQLNGANPARLNLALVTPDTGECVRPGECYVPLDHGAGGWKEESGRVQLPAFVCRLLTGKNLRLATSTDTCAAKEAANPVCNLTAGPSSGGASDGTPGRISLFRCGSTQGTCSDAEIAPYTDCVIGKCDSSYAACFGPGWRTGEVSGPCGTWVTCFNACACSDTACVATCGSPPAECQACIQSSSACAQACTAPPCASISAPTHDGGASSGTGKTCADLAACCARITNATVKGACDQAMATAADDPARCGSAYDAFASYCL